MAYPYIPAKSISYGGTRALSSVKYIVIHYTGNDNDTALANCNFFKNSNTRSAGCHWFVDRSGAVYQSIKMGRIAWSVGGFFTQSNGAGSYYKKCTNTNSVSIEMCDVKSQYPSGAQVAAIKTLIAYIQSECPNAKTIIRHWDVNGKPCPARMTGTNNAEWKRLYSELTGKTAVSSGTTSSTTQKPSSSTPTPSKSNKISVDGVWGKATTKAAQKVFKTPVDGIVSKQIAKYKKYMSACSSSSWQFLDSNYKGGSQLIKAIQKWVGVAQDGLCGQTTIKYLQKKLGVTADGYMGKQTVTAFQKYLNKYL